MRGQFQFSSAEPRRGASRYARLVASEFRSADAVFVTANDTSVTIRDRLFGFGQPFGLLTYVRSGHIALEPQDVAVNVRFEFQMTTWVFLAGLAAIALVALLVARGAEWRLFEILLSLGGFHVGFGYLLAHSRLNRVLRSIAKRVEEVDPTP